MSRRIEDLHPELKVKFLSFSGLMAQEGIPFILTCTLRTEAQQLALFAQGRKTLKAVNELRKDAGLPPITDKENRRPVTWTLKSKHLSGKAFDIAIVRDGRPIWDVKVSVDADSMPDYLEATEIGRKLSLVCGADFKNPDYPHFELKEGT